MYHCVEKWEIFISRIFVHIKLLSFDMVEVIDFYNRKYEFLVLPIARCASSTLVASDRIVCDQEIQLAGRNTREWRHLFVNGRRSWLRDQHTHTR